MVSYFDLYIVNKKDKSGGGQGRACLPSDRF